MLQQRIGNRTLSRLLAGGMASGPTVRATGRAAPEFAALVRRSSTTGMIQLVRSEVQPLRRGVGVSLDALEAYRGDIEGQLADLHPAEVARGFIDLTRVAEWQAQYATALGQLRTALGAAGLGDDHTVLPADVMARTNALATCFHAALIRLVNIRHALNQSLEAYGFYREGQEALAEGSALGEEKKRTREEATSSGSGGDSSGTAEDRVTTFPHKGKHAPPPKIAGKIRAIERATAGPGETALYLTNDPPTVVGWEDTARRDGLLLPDGFTVVHRFNEVIGADQGEATSCIRIDGDHGHPIIQSGSKTGFDSYIERAIEQYLKDADHENLKRVAVYLVSVGLDPRRYRIPPEDLP
jgi:hypothetical protein